MRKVIWMGLLAISCASFSSHAQEPTAGTMPVAPVSTEAARIPAESNHAPASVNPPALSPVAPNPAPVPAENSASGTTPAPAAGAAAAVTPEGTPVPVQAPVQTTSIEELKKKLARTSLNYFLENAHPKTGLVRDKADNFSSAPLDTDRVASIAAVGFALAVISHASTQGLVEPAMAEAYANKVVKFMRDKVPRRKGWFLHWIDWETGERAWRSEYSTIDTALFMAGALYAAQVFPKAKFAPIVRQLYRDLDFYDVLTDGGTKPNKKTLSMGYFRETGYVQAQWNMYAEQMILLILGLGHPTKPAPISLWTEWQRTTQRVGEFDVMGFDQALFVHQYSQLFIDFRNFNDSFRNYYQNTVEITKLHRRMAKPDAKYKTLKEGFWGFSAGEAPDLNYKVYDGLRQSSTVCVGCALGSLAFSPSEVLSDASKWIDGPYKDRVWGKYGFVDSLDLDRNWFANVAIAITVGPTYMSLMNMNEETSFWKTFMEVPEIKKGLERASRAINTHAPPPPPTAAPAAPVQEPLGLKKATPEPLAITHPPSPQALPTDLPKATPAKVEAAAPVPTASNAAPEAPAAATVPPAAPATPAEAAPVTSP